MFPSSKIKHKKVHALENTPDTPFHDIHTSICHNLKKKEREREEERESPSGTW